MPEEEHTTESQATSPTPQPAAPVAEAAPVAPAAITKADIEKNKTWAVVSYLTIIGLIIALVSDGKESPFVKFHINQSLILFIGVVISIAISMIPILGWILSPFLSLGILIFVIIGIINAAGGKVKRLPLIGDFDLIK